MHHIKHAVLEDRFGRALHRAIELRIGVEQALGLIRRHAVRTRLEGPEGLVERVKRPDMDRVSRRAWTRSAVTV